MRTLIARLLCSKCRKCAQNSGPGFLSCILCSDNEDHLLCPAGIISLCFGRYHWPRKLDLSVLLPAPIFQSGKHYFFEVYLRNFKLYFRGREKIVHYWYVDWFFCHSLQIVRSFSSPNSFQEISSMYWWRGNFRDCVLLTGQRSICKSWKIILKTSVTKKPSQSVAQQMVTFLTRHRQHPAHLFH